VYRVNWGARLTEVMYMLGAPASTFHHGLCTRDHCYRSIIDEMTYVPCHIDVLNDQCEDCSCLVRSNQHLGARDLDDTTDWGPSTAELERIVNDNKVPMILLKGSLDSGWSLQLQVVGRQVTSCRFVAFSQVWSHGGGHPHHNRMHFCQLHFLSKLTLDVLYEREI